MFRMKRKPESLAFFIQKYYELLNLTCGNGNINYKKNSFYVRGWLRPTSSSRYYDVEVQYKRDGFPSIWVYGILSDNIKAKEIPHKYSYDLHKNKVNLCLYRNKYHEYNRKALPSKNIVPWICEWLYFYELYLITDVWYGNGEHPRKGRIKENV